MNTDYKINRYLLDALNESIKHPFIVMDESGNILSSNNVAKILFSLEQDGVNFYDLIDEASVEKISPLFHDLNEAKKPIVRDVQFLLSSGDEIDCELTLNSYREGPDHFVFCSFKMKENKIKLRGITKIEGLSTDVKEVIKNPKILEIFEDIRSLYPFTFIGKEKIRKEIDTLDEYFWVKDSKGNYIIINNKFSKSLGLKTTQIEGKNENNFIAQYLVSIRNSIDEYISQSLNCVILQGIPVKGIPSDENYETIEIPLSDAENKVVAVLGIAQISKDFLGRNKSDLFDSFKDSAKYFPGLFVFTDTHGVIKNTSSDLKKLFAIAEFQFAGKQVDELFPGKIASSVRDFFILGGENNLLDTDEQIKIGDRNFNGLQINIDRLFSEENKLIGYSFFIEDKNATVDLEQLITGRGRMFEVLIQNNPEPIYIYDKDNLRFLEANSAALNLYGYNRDEFLQMDLTDLYTPEDIQTLLDSTITKIKESKFSGPYKHRKKDGSSIFVEISKISFKYQSKDAHFNTIRNVTEQLELEKKSQLFKASFENLSDVQFVTDSAGFIQYQNLHATKILGYSKTDFKDSSFASFFTDSERGTINSTIFKEHIKESVTLSSVMKKMDGGLLDVQLVATPIIDYNGKVDSFNILVKPKENPSIVNEVIKEVFVEKVAEQNQSATGAQNNSAFLSSAFHELLTPINVILGFVQELTGGNDDLTPDQKEAVDIINQNRLNLLSTMNAVVELAAIDRNDIEIKKAETSITAALDSLSRELEDLSSIRDVEFTYGKISASLTFYSDQQKFVSLLSQIVRIVTRLSKERKIYFSAYPYQDDSFIVSIKDGYNVSSPYLIDQLTQLFSNEETTSRKDFGISKLTQRLAKSLLKLLNGDFEIFLNDAKKRDCGFVFPLNIDQLKTTKTIVDTTTPQIDEQKIYQKPTASVESEVYNEPEITRKSGVVFKEHNPLKGDMLNHKENEFIQSSDESLPIDDQPFFNHPNGQPVSSADIHEIKNEEISPSELSAKKEREIEPQPLAFSADNYARNRRELVLSELNCLYIEDQVDSQILFKVQMKELKDIKFAVSFEDALPLLDSHSFNFIVMDINLQGEYNGLDALKIVRKMPAYENTPIIAVTAYVLPGDKEKFIATGFNDFISKPIFREKMIDSLDKIFAMR
ncbi:MAG: PAS domain S-box protein [Ignavibacteriaceae bacterium]|nr:PAS domain S-box protein [Ignavibacteriaceae bacterium]